jgi:hypothetical protein
MTTSYVIKNEDYRCNSELDIALVDDRLELTITDNKTQESVGMTLTLIDALILMHLIRDLIDMEAIADE